MVKPLSERLEECRPILLDGATAQSCNGAACRWMVPPGAGLAVASHPEIVRQVHHDYIQAGAEVIITNTFASGRHLLRAAGEEDLTESINRQAVLEARQARVEAAEAKAGAVESGWELAPEDVWIAGSISPMRPVPTVHPGLHCETWGLSSQNRPSCLPLPALTCCCWR